MIIKPLTRSPIFYNVSDYVKGVACPKLSSINSINGGESVYLNSMIKLREVLKYGNSRNPKK